MPNIREQRLDGIDSCRDSRLTYAPVRAECTTQTTQNNTVVLPHQHWQELVGVHTRHGAATAMDLAQEQPMAYLSFTCTAVTPLFQHAQHRLMHARQAGSLLWTCTVRAALLATTNVSNTLQPLCAQQPQHMQTSCSISHNWHPHHTTTGMQLPELCSFLTELAASIVFMGQIGPDNMHCLYFQVQPNWTLLHACNYPRAHATDML
jgi:hypothetical protein